MLMVLVLYMVRFVVVYIPFIVLFPKHRGN